MHPIDRVEREEDEWDMNTYTSRRKRRRARAKLKNPAAVSAHTAKGGRTGSVMAKRTPGKGRRYSTIYPNPRAPDVSLG